ncbi:hypothetical protein NECID01_0724 [Nematocida sp. AWRm77]|nr:hypothetical protein NECID01_0724 [Nematocida sp. AWRm77]
MDELDRIFTQKKTSTKKNTPKEKKPSPKDTYSIRQENNKTLSKHTEEGFRIYSTEDLNIGKGGQTEECPFDCTCCF